MYTDFQRRSLLARILPYPRTVQAVKAYFELSHMLAGPHSYLEGEIMCTGRGVNLTENDGGNERLLAKRLCLYGGWLRLELLKHRL